MAKIHIFIWIFQLFSNMYLKYSPFPLDSIVTFSIACCCCCSVAQSCLTLCDPMDCSKPGLSVPHHLPKFAQVHVHCISDAIQPSHPLRPSSLSASNLSQHQGLFQWVSCLHQMTKILELKLQHSSFQSKFHGWSPVRLTFLISLLSKGLSGIFSSITVQRHQFFGACLLYGPALKQPYMTTEKTIALSIQIFVDRVMSLLFNTV